MSAPLHTPANRPFGPFHMRADLEDCRECKGAGFLPDQDLRTSVDCWCCDGRRTHRASERAACTSESSDA